MNIELFKLIAFFAIFIAGMTGGLVSKWLSSSSKSKTIFSLGNVFAGGVFLGAGFIHMLPDAQSGFAAITKGADYPWFALVCCAGFLFILMLERVLLPHQHEAAPKATSEKKILYPLILMFILSIHSIIAGIALGIEERITQAIVILFAVLAHKGTAAFALGISMLRSKMERRKFFTFIAFFSFMTPLGLFLGYLFSVWLSGSAEQIFEAVFDALAAGTFIYIAILDILNEEFTSKGKNLLKFALVLAGLGIMALVAVWT